MIKIDWSENAESDLQFIFDRVKRKTCSDNLARNVINDIYSASVNIQFTEQYQVDETLGKPYRRMIVSHFKIIYKPLDNTHIRILEIFDSYQNPIRLRK